MLYLSGIATKICIWYLLRLDKNIVFQANSSLTRHGVLYFVEIKSHSTFRVDSI